MYTNVWNYKCPKNDLYKIETNISTSSLLIGAMSYKNNHDNWFHLYLVISSVSKDE